MIFFHLKIYHLIIVSLYLEIPLHNPCAAVPLGQTAYYVEVFTKVVARGRVLAVSTDIVFIDKYFFYRCVNKANHVFIYNCNTNY